MIAIIAVNENHFRHFCREVGLPIDKTVVQYCFCPESLAGLIGSKEVYILTLPEWYKGKTSEQVDKFE